MKAFYVMFVVFAVLLLGASMASAQDSSPSCSGGSAYDLTGHGCVTGYANGSAAAASIAPKAPGLAASVGAEKQDPTMDWISAQERNANLAAADQIVPQNAAAPKPAGLAKLTPVEGIVSCRAGENLDPLLDPLALACLSQPIPAAKAASKPAGLAAPAPAVIPEQGWSGCPWGDAYDPMVQGYLPACFSRPADNAAALKPAGLAKIAPVEAFVPCGYGERLDPLLDPLALACLR